MHNKTKLFTWRATPASAKTSEDGVALTPIVEEDGNENPEILETLAAPCESETVWGESRSTPRSSWQEEDEKG